MRRMEKFFTTEQAAMELGVTPTRARQLIRAGILKAHQYGRAYLVTPAAIAAARKRHDKPGPIPKAQQQPPSTAGRHATGHASAKNGSSTRGRKGGQK
jgi:excisionase family DNA binding protein